MAYTFDPDDEDQFFYDNQGVFSPDLLRMGPAFPMKPNWQLEDDSHFPSGFEEMYTEKTQDKAIRNTIGEDQGYIQQSSSIYDAIKPNYGKSPFDKKIFYKSWDIAYDKYDYYQQLKQLRRDSEIDEVPDIAPAGEDNFADIGRPNLNTAEIAAQTEGPMDIPILQPEGPSIDDVAEQTFKTTNIEMPQSLPTKPLLDKPAWDAKGGGMGKVQTAGAVAQLAAGGIGMLDKTEEVDAPNYIAGILGSAGQGASMGAMFGPWGAAIGGVLGAGAGLVKTISQDKATNARISQREEQEKRFLQARSTTQTNPLYAEEGIKVPTNQNSNFNIRPSARINYSKTGREQGQLSGSLGFRASDSKNIAENLDFYTSTYGNVNLGSQGTGVNAGLGAGLNVGIGDSWNFNPFMNVDASFMGGQMNTGIRGGARLSYMFKEGGKTPNYISQLDQLIL